jgi:hypothetical protein
MFEHVTARPTTFILSCNTVPTWTFSFLLLQNQSREWRKRKQINAVCSPWLRYLLSNLLFGFLAVRGTGTTIQSSRNNLAQPGLYLQRCGTSSSASHILWRLTEASCDGSAVSKKEVVYSPKMTLSCSKQRKKMSLYSSTIQQQGGRCYIILHMAFLQVNQSCCHCLPPIVPKKISPTVQNGLCAVSRHAHMNSTTSDSSKAVQTCLAIS